MGLNLRLDGLQSALRTVCLLGAGGGMGPGSPGFTWWLRRVSGNLPGQQGAHLAYLVEATADPELLTRLSFRGA